MKRIAFDLSSFLKTCLYGGKDEESGRVVEHEGKPVWVNSAHHGYEKCLSRMLDVLKFYHMTPIQVVLVVEGDRSKAKRLMIDGSYKASRATHPPESNLEFHKAKQMLVDLWLGLGAISLTQDLAEGDDTLAWLALNTEEDLVIATFDNDLAVLNGVNSYGANTEVWVDGLAAVNKYGLFDFNLITTYKALVGDSSDNIKGCKGFGPAAFEKFCIEYGFDGLAEVHAMLAKGDLSELEELALTDKNKQLAMIVNQKAEVQRSFDLARMRPEWVNTMAHPLQWGVGRVRQVQKSDDPRLKPWYGKARLITAENFEAACEWALEKIAESEEVALDIETSTPDESDEWLRGKGKEDGVDVFGSRLCGLGLTFGDNNQFTLYISVDHADTDNVSSEAVRQFIAKIPKSKPIVIQNVNFELPVLFNEWGAKQADNGYKGFLPNVLDTKIESSYVNENLPSGLKECSLRYLGYRQRTYEETVNLTGQPEDLPKGGRMIATNYLYREVATGKMVPAAEGSDDLVEEIKRELVEYATGETEEVVKGKKTVTVPVMAPVVESITRRYKMNELTAHQVFGYGADDPICTIALHNFYKLHMQLEHCWGTYKLVEIDAAYSNSSAFISGIPFSIERMNACATEDLAEVNKAWPVLRQFLIDKGWDGVKPPVFDRSITPAQLKEAYTILTGEDLGTAMRTMSKLVIWLREEKNQPALAALLERMIDPAVTDPQMIAMYERKFNEYVQSAFKGEPIFNIDSPVQMKHLMYDVLGLPVRISNKLTDVQRAKGATTGTPKTDDLAIQNALHFDGEKTDLKVLKAIQTLKQCGTRSKLFYEPYKSFPHWVDNLLHPSTNQCATVTRRNSASDPNYTQWPAKGEGIKFRECIVARGEGRVIISSDSSGQELRLAADLSRDPAMLSCYIGDNKKDIHSMVASSAAKFFLGTSMTYEEFYAELKGEDATAAEKFDALRTKSKAVNFGEIYGMQALTLSHRLMITEAEAQAFLDAKKTQFPGVDKWKDQVVERARKTGYSSTMLGARRHMRDVLINGDKWEISKAERQLSNAEIQSSGAEAVKIALGKCFFSEVMIRCDVHIIGSIHDEIVVDCPAEHAFEVATELVKFMSAQYANMIVPFESETTIGIDFGKQLKLPMGFSKEAVEKVLTKLFPSKVAADKPLVEELAMS